MFGVFDKPGGMSFAGTFTSCQSLTNSLPPDLFGMNSAGLIPVIADDTSGAGSFSSTFSGCANLGDGALTPYMFGRYTNPYMSMF